MSYDLSSQAHQAIGSGLANIELTYSGSDPGDERSTFLDRSFPFFVAMSQDLEIMSLGTSLARCVPGVMRGDKVWKHFNLGPARLGRAAEEWLSRAGEEIQLVSRFGTFLDLRGRLEKLPLGGFLFLALPILDSPESFAIHGLQATDFPPSSNVHALVKSHSRQRNLEAKLEVSRHTIEKLYSVLGLVNSGVMFVNRDADISYMNSAFTAALDLNPLVAVNDSLTVLDLHAIQRYECIPYKDKPFSFAVRELLKEEADNENRYSFILFPRAFRAETKVQVDCFSVLGGFVFMLTEHSSRLAS